MLDQNVNEWERAASATLGSLLVVSALRRSPLAGAARLLAGGALLYRGMSGHCAAYAAMNVRTKRNAAPPPELHRSVTIAASPQDLYTAWRNPATLAQIGGSFGSLKAAGDRWRWTVVVPLQGRLQWDSEIIDDRPGEHLAWQSIGGSSLSPSGAVHFGPQKPDWGTVVRLTMRFDAPPGTLTGAMLRALSILPKTAMAKMLRRFKSLVESGEIPTTKAQPAARNGGRDH